VTHDTHVQHSQLRI